MRRPFTFSGIRTEGTATNIISNGILCSNSPIGTRKGQPQAPYQAEFSVRIAHRSPKGTATSTISNGILCSNSPSEPEETAINTISSGFLCSNSPSKPGTGQGGHVPWPAWLSWRQQQKLSAVFGIPTYALRHARHRGQGSFIAKLSGQERRRDMHPTQS